MIAKQINPQRRQTPLVLSVGAASTKIKEVLSFSAANTAVPGDRESADRLQPAHGHVRHRWDDDPEADYHVMRGQSAIDLVKGDLDRYQSLKMSKADQIASSGLARPAPDHRDRA